MKKDVSGKLVYDGKIFQIYQSEKIDEYGNKHIIEKATRADVVTVIAIDSNNHIALIREFRAGKERRIYWFPGGKIENNESALETAKRELLEETGLTSDDIGIFHTKSHSDYFTNQGFVFLAKNIKTASIRTVGDEISKIDVEMVPIELACKYAISGKITNEFFCYLILKLAYSLFGKIPL